MLDEQRERGSGRGIGKASEDSRHVVGEIGHGFIGRVSAQRVDVRVHEWKVGGKAILRPLIEMLFCRATCCRVEIDHLCDESPDLFVSDLRQAGQWVVVP